MSDVLETIKSRRSIRKYKSDMIPQDKLEKIIEAGTYAATGMGKQSPIIIAVTNKELRDKLSAKEYLKKGVYGIDILGYRYTGDAVRLNEEFVRAVDAPVCIAGSINDYQRLNEIRKAGPWAFTIGSAFFDNKFEGDFGEQINKVCQYIKSESAKC